MRRAPMNELRWTVGVLAAAVLCACPAPSSDGGDAGPGAGAGGTGGAAGAGGVAGTGGAADAGDPVGEGCDEYRRALCDYYFGCPIAVRYGFPGGFPYTSAQDCYQKHLSDCREQFSQPSYSFTKAHLTACAASVRADVCRGEFSGACFARGLRGSKTDGANCRSGYECASATCSRGAGSGCGTCVPEATVGTTCVNGSQCGNAAQDLLCDNGACARVTLGAAGATCGSDTQQCAAGLLCSAGQCTGSSGLADVGATCSSAQRCKLGLECVDTLCAAYATYTDAEDCLAIGGVNKACPVGKQCVQQPSGEGRCQTPTVVGLGASCNALAGRICAAPYDCRGVTPTCEVVPAPTACN